MSMLTDVLFFCVGGCLGAVLTAACACRAKHDWDRPELRS